jgi:uncharacterized membrane protein YgcG
MSDRLQALRARLSPGIATNAPGAPAVSAWSAPEPAAAVASPADTDPTAPLAAGVPLTLSIERGAREVTVTLFFGPELAGDPGLLRAVIEDMLARGVPIKAWEPRRDGGGRSWGGGGGGGGNRFGGGGGGRYNGGGGGYGRQRERW